MNNPQDPIQEIWNTQQAREPSTQPVVQRADRESRQLRLSIGGLVFAGVCSVVNLGLKFERISRDDRFSLANSAWDIVLALFGVLCVLMTTRHVAQQHKRWRALSQKPRAWLEFQIQETRNEMNGLTKALPLALLAILGVVGLAKEQTIAGGMESIDNAMGGVALVVALMVLLQASAYHRATWILKPKLKSLEVSLDDFVQENPEKEEGSRRESGA